MSSRVQEKGHATGVANGDYIEVTLDSAVTVGNRLVVSGGSYNSAQIDATFLSLASGTATLGSFVIGHSEKRTGDGFCVAIASAVVTGAGTATIRLNVTGNNYYNLYVAEWSGLGPAIYSAGGQNSTGTTGTTSAMSPTINGRAFGAWTNATGTVTITPDGAWTEEHEYEDNSSTLCLSVISKAVAPGDSVTPTWTLSGNTSWVAAGVIFAEESPAIFGFGATSSPSANTAVQTQTLNSPYWISAGSRVYVGFAPWSTAASAAIDPTVAMLSDNIGNAASSYARLILLDTADYAGAADPNVPGQALFESPAIGTNTTAPVVTVDIDPGGSGTGYWTTSVVVIKSPSTDDGTRIASATEDFRPTVASPGTIPTIVPFGTGTKTSDHWVAVVFGFNRGHDADADISNPTEGGTWTQVVHNEESSQYWSGLGAYLEGTATSSLTPTMVITRNDSNTVTKTRGVMVIVNLADGTPVGGGKVTKSIRTHPLGMSLGMRRVGR
jgi:hypothetical protein